jgi:hypothetical protein
MNGKYFNHCMLYLFGVAAAFITTHLCGSALVGTLERGLKGEGSDASGDRCLVQESSVVVESGDHLVQESPVVVASGHPLTDFLGTAFITVVLLLELLRGSDIFNTLFYGERSRFADNRVTLPPLVSEDTSQKHHPNADSTKFSKFYIKIFTFLSQKWHIDAFMNRSIGQMVFEVAEYFQKRIEPGISGILGILPKLDVLVERIVAFGHRVFCQITFYSVFLPTSPTILSAVYFSYAWSFFITMLKVTIIVCGSVIPDLYPFDDFWRLRVQIYVAFFLLGGTYAWLLFFFKVILFLRNSCPFPSPRDPLYGYVALFFDKFGENVLFYQPAFFVCNQFWFRSDFITRFFSKLRISNPNFQNVFRFLVCVLFFVLLYWLI